MAPSMIGALGAAAGSAQMGYDDSQDRTQQRQMRQQQMDSQKQQDFLKSFAMVVQHTSDADLPKVTEQYNQIAPRFNLPTLTKLQRDGGAQHQYHVMTSNGRNLSVDLVTGESKDLGPADVKPIEVPPGGTLYDPTSRQPIYSSPQKAEYDRVQDSTGNYVYIPKPDSGGGGMMSGGQSQQSAPSAYSWGTGPDGKPTIVAAGGGGKPAVTPGAANPRAVAPAGQPPVNPMMPTTPTAQPAGINTGVRGPSPEKSEFQTFAEGNRDYLTNKEGWTDQGAIDRDTSNEWQKRKVELESAKHDTKSKEIDIHSLAEAVANSQDSANNIKGSMGNPVASKVKTEILKKYPKFDFNKSEANATWQKSPQNQKVISQVEGILPRMQALSDQVATLKNADLNLINKAWNSVNKEFGKPEVTNFESNRNAIVQEVGTALSGSSTGSDTRIKLELDNLKSSRGPAQLAGAIHNLNEALLSRLDTQLSVPYPPEVVRGEVSAEDYRKAMRAKYNIGDKIQRPPAQKNVPINAPPASMLQEGMDATIQNPATGSTEVWTLKNGQPVQVQQ